MFFFFFNDTATTEIYTLSLHDALPIYWLPTSEAIASAAAIFISSLMLRAFASSAPRKMPGKARSEEHTSELQSRQYLVCRLLLEKKKTTNSYSMNLTLRFNLKSIQMYR